MGDVKALVAAARRRAHVNAGELVGAGDGATYVCSYYTASDRDLDRKLADALDAQEAEIARLREALEPFASVVSDDPDADSKFIWASDPDHWDAYGQNWGKSIRVAHCRRARSSLAHGGEE